MNILVFKTQVIQNLSIQQGTYIKHYKLILTVIINTFKNGIFFIVPYFKTEKFYLTQK